MRPVSSSIFDLCLDYLNEHQVRRVHLLKFVFFLWLVLVWSHRKHDESVSFIARNRNIFSLMKEVLKFNWSSNRDNVSFQSNFSYTFSLRFRFYSASMSLIPVALIQSTAVCERNIFEYRIGWKFCGLSLYLILHSWISESFSFSYFHSNLLPT